MGVLPDDVRICRIPDVNVVVGDFAADIKCGLMTTNNLCYYTSLLSVIWNSQCASFGFNAFPGKLVSFESKCF